MRIVRSFVLAVWIMAGWGCSTFKEFHYFKDNAPSMPNYYRLKVSGGTFMTSSRYTSGYFDEEAVSEYFNELKQPPKGRIKTGLKPGDGEGNEEAIQPVDASLEGTRLVMILSSHSGAVTDQIGQNVNMKNTMSTMSAIAQLVNRSLYREQTQVELSAEIEDMKKRGLMDKGNLHIDGIAPEALTAEAAADNMLQYVNALAHYLGHTESFNSLGEAKAWFDNNRGRLLNNEN